MPQNNARWSCWVKAAMKYGHVVGRCLALVSGVCTVSTQGVHPLLFLFRSQKSSPRNIQELEIITQETRHASVFNTHVNRYPKAGHFQLISGPVRCTLQNLVEFKGINNSLSFPPYRASTACEEKIPALPASEAKESSSRQGWIAVSGFLRQRNKNKVWLHLKWVRYTHIWLYCLKLLTWARISSHCLLSQTDLEAPELSQEL